MVGIHPGLTPKQRQRVHAISELTPKKRDYRLLLTEENLITCSLTRVPSGESFSFVNCGAELAYRELGLCCHYELMVHELT